MLASARDREHELTTQVVRDRTRFFELEARVAELSAIAARVVTAEDERRRAEETAAEREREAALARAEVEAQRSELERLSSRNTELEADLAAVADELARAAVSRTEAARLEVERDEARERAQVERRLAAEDRIRAAEANLRATELQRQLREAERRIVRVANGNGDQAERTVEADVVAAQPPPWIELQRRSSESPRSAPGPEGSTEELLSDVVTLPEDGATGTESDPGEGWVAAGATGMPEAGGGEANVRPPAHGATSTTESTASTWPDLERATSEPTRQPLLGAKPDHQVPDDEPGTGSREAATAEPDVADVLPALDPDPSSAATFRTGSGHPDPIASPPAATQPAVVRTWGAPAAEAPAAPDTDVVDLTAGSAPSTVEDDRADEDDRASEDETAHTEQAWSSPGADEAPSPNERLWRLIRGRRD
jgi:hypothetical protein